MNERFDVSMIETYGKVLSAGGNAGWITEFKPVEYARKHSLFFCLNNF